MAGVSEPGGPWTGASGTAWAASEDAEPLKAGGDWSALPVQAVSPSRVGARRTGVLLRPRRDAVREELDRELSTLERLAEGGAASPGLRLLERIPDGSGAVVERWQENLEDFWLRTWLDPEGFRLLCLAMADLCRRVGDWSAVAARSPEVARHPPRIRPRSVLRSQTGRWVLSGFGAAVPSELQASGDEAGTEIMSAVSHFQPPEELFLARHEHPMAGLTWSIAETFLSLLKLRGLCTSAPGGGAAEMPAAGTDSPHLGSHRASLVEDLWRRKPALFVDRPLDPRQFLYPDRLPERDRRTVGEALAGSLGGGQQHVEARIERECLRLLDSALAVEPSRRYLDPLVLAGDFEGLARSFQEARLVVLERASRPRGEAREQPKGGPNLEDPTEETPPVEDVTVVGEAAGRGSAAFSDAATVSIGEAEDVDDAPTSQPVATVVVSPPPPKAVVRAEDDEDVPLPPVVSTPRWVAPAIGALAVGQAITLGLVIALWLRPPVVVPAAAGSTALLDAALDSPAPAPAAEVVAVAEAEAAPPIEEEPAVEAPAAEAPAAEAPAVEPPAAAPAPPREATGTSTARSTTVSTPPAVAATAPATTSAASPSTPGSSQARVSASGAEIRLRAPAGMVVSPGLVESGTWTVLVREGDQWLEAGTIQLAPGEQAVVKCGFGRCRKI